jgi:hypothetical protein
MRYLSLVLLLFLAACNVSQNPEVTLVPPTIEVTNEPATQSPQGFVTYWMGSDQAISDESVLVGCQTYVTPIESTSPLGSPEDNIRNSLTQMFTTPSQEGQRNVWGDDMALTVNSVTIENGLATIQLAGDIMMLGTCADAEMEAQLLLAVFNEPSVQSALIMLGDTNMRSFFDMSGQAGADFQYTRDNIPYANP